MKKIKKERKKEEELRGKKKKKKRLEEEREKKNPHAMTIELQQVFVMGPTSCVLLPKH